MKACPTCHVDNPLDSRFCQNCGGSLMDVAGLPEDPFLGQMFVGKFHIQRVLGQGAMGKVYLAEQVNLGRPVCIKILHPHLATDENLAKRFNREARAASRLNHPNSIQITDFGRSEDGTLFLAMEYLAGTDLRRLIKRDFPLAPDRIVRLLGQVLSALEEAHGQNIIHRDLKPENIMVVDTRAEKDLVKVLDFGIAKIQEPEVEGGTLTVAGIVCGTPEYMAPEQARGDPLDNRVDLYAAGVILYQLLSGELPFKAESALATVTKHLTEDPIPPSQRHPEFPVPQVLEDICLKAMSKDREERFSSALQMKQELEAAVAPDSTGPVVLAAAPVAAPAGTNPGLAATGTPAPQPRDGSSHWSVGALDTGDDSPSNSLQTPLAFAVEEEPARLPTKSSGMAAWIAAIAILVLGGVAVALWKLEIGPFAPSGGPPPATSRPQPSAPPAPTPSASATPEKTTAVKEATTAPKVAAVKEMKAFPEPDKTPAEVAKEKPKTSKSKTVAKSKKKRKSKSKTKTASKEKPETKEVEDPEAALKTALAAAASKRRTVAATNPTEQPANPTEVKADPPPKPKPKPQRRGLPPRDPRVARAAYVEGKRLLRRNQVAAAVAKLKDAVRYNPRNAIYHRELGTAHLRNRNRRHGLWHYRKYLQLFPDAPDATRIRAMIEGG